MGKIVKYCAACEESFAEKFSFCPNCAQPLTAFEMNPVSGSEAQIAAPVETAAELNNQPPTEKIEPVAERIVPVLEPKKAAKKKGLTPIVPAATFNAEPTAEIIPPVESSNEATTQIFTASNQTRNYNLADIEELNASDKVEVAPSETSTKTFAAAAGASGSINRQTPSAVRSNINSAKDSDDGFHITVIEEKNGKQRAGLLLGTLVVMVVVSFGAIVYSIFNKDMGIGAIDSDNPVFLAVLDDVPPPPVEIEQPKPKKNDDDGGGGGGGGNKNPDPVTKGDPPTQVAKPVAPLMMVPKMTNPDIKIVNQTQGTIVRPPTDKQVGLPTGLTSDRLSSGGGSGGGFGNGRGAGAGNGIGTGEGNGNGSGSGNGNGNGNGNGRGDGSGVPKAPPPPPPAPPSGPPTPINITYKPQPRYTDAARQNSVTGTVTLKVTFMANGQIGSVAPVSGLPYGLTEQAIAAAKAIKFDPPKRNGAPYSVSKTISYSFTIY